MKKTILCAIAMLTCNSVFAHDIGTAVWNVSSYTGWESQIHSQHHARLINNTNTPQTYFFYARLCADNAGCTPTETARVTVPAHSEKTIRRELFLSHTYRHPGTYNVNAVTDVQGDGGQHKEMNATVTVR